MNKLLKSGPLFFLLLIAGLLLIDTIKTELIISPRITIKEEFDDNVNLAEGKSDSIKRDFVSYFMPAVSLKQLYRLHLFYLDLSSSYRRGFNTDLSNLNLNFSGGFDLLFNGGLGIFARDSYLRTSFDRALYDEAGIYKRNSNIFAAGLSYTYSPVNRLMLELNYQNKQDIYDERQSNLQRQINAFQGSFSFPLTQALLGYVEYCLENQESQDRRARNYMDNRLVGGFKWKGAARVVFYLEGGYEQITYDLPEMSDFKRGVGKTGISILFSESAIARVMAGQDGYGNPVFDAYCAYNYSDKTYLSLSARRETMSSFSLVHKDGIIEYTWGQLQFTKHMFHKFILVLNGNYQLQQSQSYVNQYIRHSIWTFFLSYTYNIQEWINCGISAQYATRISYNDRFDYKNSRIGIFIRLAR